MQFQNMNTLKNLVLVLLGLYFVAIVVSAGSNLLQVSLLTRIGAGEFTNQEQLMAVATANDNREQYVSWAVVATFALSGLASLFWTYGATKNAGELSALPRKFSPGWAVGWYFIPIASLWKPYQAMQELWRRSAFPATVAASSNLGWWWFLWIAGNFVSQAAGRASTAADSLQFSIVATWIDFVADAIAIPLIVVYAGIISRITAMQIAKHAASPDKPRDQAILDMPSAQDPTPSET